MDIPKVDMQNHGNQRFGSVIVEHKGHAGQNKFQTISKTINVKNTFLQM